MWTTIPNDTTMLTEELGVLIENGFTLWDFDYPSFYQGEAKTAFEQKVIDHYYFRQIGFETTGRFHHQFKTKMREIMPYYIQLYESEHIQDEVNPFDNYLLEETFERTVKNNTSNSSTTGLTQSSQDTRTEATTTNVDLKGTNKFSDTPQGNIENLDTHLTNATVNHDETVTAHNATSGTMGSMESSATNSGTEEGEQTEEYRIYRHGNIGVQTFGDELQKYRDVMLNIDMLVINELNCLFLGVY